MKFKIGDVVKTLPAYEQEQGTGIVLGERLFGGNRNGLIIWFFSGSEWRMRQDWYWNENQDCYELDEDFL